MKDRIVAFFSGESELPRWFRWLPLGLLVLIPLYMHAARGHTATWNHDLYQNDQKVYLRIAQKLKTTDYEYFTPRQRTPGFSYVLAPFWKDDYLHQEKRSRVSEVWFEKGKQVNIWLSTILLIGLYFFFHATTGGAIPAMMATLASGFLLYVFRAGYTQPELLYWSLNVVAYYLLMRMLWAPTWKVAITGGFVSGVAFFVKAGTQPLLLLFVVSFGVKLLWDWLYHKRRPQLVTILQGATVPLVFATVLAPYLHGTYKVFGDPFYSTYSKYIMWVKAGDDSFKHEMYAIMNAGAADHPITEQDFQKTWNDNIEMMKEKSPDLWKTLSAQPTPDLPTLERYLRDHTAAEIIARPIDGLVTNHKRIQKYYTSAYSFLGLCLCAAGILTLFNYQNMWKLVCGNLPVVFYITGFFTGYLVLYGWYDGLRIGARLILSLYVPAIFSLIWFLSRKDNKIVIKIGKGGIDLQRVLFTLLFIALAVKVVAVLTGELYAEYSGA